MESGWTKCIDQQLQQLAKQKPNPQITARQNHLLAIRPLRVALDAEQEKTRQLKEALADQHTQADNEKKNIAQGREQERVHFRQQQETLQTEKRQLLTRLEEIRQQREGEQRSARQREQELLTEVHRLTNSLEELTSQRVADLQEHEDQSERLAQTLVILQAMCERLDTID